MNVEIYKSDQQGLSLETEPRDAFGTIKHWDEVLLLSLVRLIQHIGRMQPLSNITFHGSKLTTTCNNYFNIFIRCHIVAIDQRYAGIIVEYIQHILTIVVCWPYACSTPLHKLNSTLYLKYEPTFSSFALSWRPVFKNYEVWSLFAIQMWCPDFFEGTLCPDLDILFSYVNCSSV